VWICSKTGHWFRPIDVVIFNIKTNDLNQDYSATICCRCCGEVFVSDKNNDKAI
jgi:hypothetical protein